VIPDGWGRHPMTDILMIPARPLDRGRLLSADEVARLIGEVSSAWVRRHVPHKLTLGHSTVRWYEGDVRAWLERCRSRLDPGL
jgi:predicted DNA-binding transcriptional regulator AlpA